MPDNVGKTTVAVVTFGAAVAVFVFGGLLINDMSRVSDNYKAAIDNSTFVRGKITNAIYDDMCRNTNPNELNVCDEKTAGANITAETALKACILEEINDVFPKKATDIGEIDISEFYQNLDDYTGQSDCCDGDNAPTGIIPRFRAAMALKVNACCEKTGSDCSLTSPAKYDFDETSFDSQMTGTLQHYAHINSEHYVADKVHTGLIGILVTFSSGAILVTISEVMKLATKNKTPPEAKMGGDIFHMIYTTSLFFSFSITIVLYTISFQHAFWNHQFNDLLSAGWDVNMPEIEFDFETSDATEGNWLCLFIVLVLSFASHFTLKYGLIAKYTKAVEETVLKQARGASKVKTGPRSCGSSKSNSSSVANTMHLRSIHST